MTLSVHLMFARGVKQVGVICRAGQIAFNFLAIAEGDRHVGHLEARIASITPLIAESIAREQELSSALS